MPTRRTWAIAAGLSALLSACASTDSAERPLVTPLLFVESGVNAGSAITGPLPLASSAIADPVADLASILNVHTRALWVESGVPTADSLEPHAGLVIGSGAAEPVLPFSRRAGDVGFARGDDAERLMADIALGLHGRTATTWADTWAIWAGTTLSLDVASDDGKNAVASTDAQNAIGSSGVPAGIDSFLLAASHAQEPGAARVALSIGSYLDPAQELIVLRDALRATDGPMVFVFHRAVSRAARDEPAALVVVLEVVDESAPQREPSIAHIDLETSMASAAERRREFTRAEAERREIQDVAASLGAETDRRARLVFLASSCEAPLALDVALIAQDADLKAFAEIVQNDLSRPSSRADAGWRMERGAWLWLGRKSAVGEIAPELAGILTRHGGAAARFPGAIDDLLRGENSIAGLAQRLAAENRIFLEDASPASRLRAYDWLAARGLAPAGYDPFGTLAERRAALLAVTETQEAATVQPGAPR